MLMGPHTALGNIPRSIEYSVDWVTGALRFARDNGLTRLEGTQSGVDAWTDHVKALGVGLLSNEVDSWMTGINRNVEGKTRRIIARYSGSAPAYRARCDEVAAKGYDELRLGECQTLMVRRRASAVSNHAGPADATRPASFETRFALLRMRDRPGVTLEA